MHLLSLAYLFEVIQVLFFVLETCWGVVFAAKLK